MGVLISKKELLDITGISYSQLYRWKRKKLIPEEWFIKKSTFTGQETFFPKDKILERIVKIINLKKKCSFESMSDLFSPKFAEITLEQDQILHNNIVTLRILNLLYEQFGAFAAVTFEKIFYGYLIEKILGSGEISLEEVKPLLLAMRDIFFMFDNQHYDIVFIRKLGVSTCFLASNSNQLIFEKNVRVLARFNIAGCIEEFRTRLISAGLLNN